jgi:hypothetical protein
LNAYIERSISFSLQFIINQLSNIGIVPDDLLSAYQDRRSTQFKIDNSRTGEGGKLIQGNNTDEVSKIAPINPFENQGKIKEKLMKGVFQIIKLVIDESVASRRIVDSSIAQEQGSILNSIRKLCQEPFVEFSSDTYGDQYFLTVRQPPFTRELFQSLIYGDVKIETPKVVENTRGDVKIIEEEQKTGENSICIDIEESDIIQENLMFNDEEVYTWYRLTPQAVFFGKGSDMTLAFLPAIYIPELVEVFGAKSLDIVTNYVPYNPIVGADAKQSADYLEKQVFYDLKYIIDSHIYLPFTRKGTIVINGDRRIKRGTVIRHKGTGEIYYVDAVCQTGAISDQMIERTTTLQVSRGMVEDFVRGKYVEIDGENVFVSYFDIMNTKLREEFFIVRNKTNTTVNTNVLKDWRINSKVLNFFIRRGQLK